MSYNWNFVFLIFFVFFFDGKTGDWETDEWYNLPTEFYEVLVG